MTAAERQLIDDVASLACGVEAVEAWQRLAQSDCSDGSEAHYVMKVMLRVRDDVVLAERERCARVAQAYNSSGQAPLASQIAADIRSTDSSMPNFREFGEALNSRPAVPAQCAAPAGVTAPGGPAARNTDPQPVMPVTAEMVDAWQAESLERLGKFKWADGPTVAPPHSESAKNREPVVADLCVGLAHCVGEQMVEFQAGKGDSGLDVKVEGQR